MDTIKAKIKNIITTEAYTVEGVTRREYEWNSEKHEEAMQGDEPEYDPLELYGKWVEKYYKDARTHYPETYTLYLEVIQADRLVPSAVYGEQWSNQFICTYGAKLEPLEAARGKSPYKIGDEIELILLYQAAMENS